MATKLLLSTKLKNEIKKIPGDYTFYLKNIKINGVTRGCSGFIRNNKNNTYVYVDTERNRWVDTVPELVTNITKLLKYDPKTENDTRI